MKIPVKDIIVQKRIRRDLGDIKQLAESIEKHGLLNPIVITQKRVLIAGERRLESVKLLGWEEVPVTVIDNPTKIEAIEIEIDENLHRKAFNPDEASDAFLSLEKLRNPGLLSKIFKAISGFFKKIAALFKRPDQ